VRNFLKEKLSKTSKIPQTFQKVELFVEKRNSEKQQNPENKEFFTIS
jgi:hypothetical protein